MHKLFYTNIMKMYMYMQSFLLIYLLVICMRYEISFCVCDENKRFICAVASYLYNNKLKFSAYL